jgi:hypothetical protein
MSGIAIRIDIETELNAIKAGQCGGCRIGTTHPIDKPCYSNKEHYKNMEHCPKCNNMFCKDYWNKCPVCYHPKH